MAWAYCSPEAESVGSLFWVNGIGNTFDECKYATFMFETHATPHHGFVNTFDYCKYAISLLKGLVKQGEWLDPMSTFDDDTESEASSS
eukprot:gene17060-23355_t